MLDVVAANGDFSRYAVPSLPRLTRIHLMIVVISCLLDQPLAKNSIYGTLGDIVQKELSGQNNKFRMSAQQMPNLTNSG